MVFGWGKKKKQVEVEEHSEPAQPTSQSITLDEIPKVLEDLVTLREKTLVESRSSSMSMPMPTMRRSTPSSPRARSTPRSSTC